MNPQIYSIERFWSLLLHSCFILWIQLVWQDTKLIFQITLYYGNYSSGQELKCSSVKYFSFLFSITSILSSVTCSCLLKVPTLSLEYELLCRTNIKSWIPWKVLIYCTTPTKPICCLGWLENCFSMMFIEKNLNVPSIASCNLLHHILSIKCNYWIWFVWTSVNI